MSQRKKIKCILEACPIDCQGNWSEWSSCKRDGKEVTCGDATRTKTFNVSVNSENGGSICPENLYQCCNLEDCPIDCEGNWSEWSSCKRDGKEVTCGEATKTRSYNVTFYPKNGGKACPKDEEENCNLKACPVDCQGSWSEWSSCKKDGEEVTCGDATRTRSFNVSVNPKNGGKACPESQEESCNLIGCPVDCQGYWKDWSKCMNNGIEINCGEGTQTSEFMPIINSKNGGQACPENEQRKCNLGSCQQQQNKEEPGECDGTCDFVEQSSYKDNYPDETVDFSEFSDDPKDARDELEKIKKLCKEKSNDQSKLTFPNFTNKHEGKFNYYKMRSKDPNWSISLGELCCQFDKRPDLPFSKDEDIKRRKCETLPKNICTSTIGCEWEIKKDKHRRRAPIKKEKGKCVSENPDPNGSRFDGKKCNAVTKRNDCFGGCYWNQNKNECESVENDPNGKGGIENKLCKNIPSGRECNDGCVWLDEAIVDENNEVVTKCPEGTCVGLKPGQAPDPNGFQFKNGELTEIRCDSLDCSECNSGCSWMLTEQRITKPPMTLEEKCKDGFYEVNGVGMWSRDFTQAEIIECKNYFENEKIKELKNKYKIIFDKNVPTFSGIVVRRCQDAIVKIKKLSGTDESSKIYFIVEDGADILSAKKRS